MTPARAIATAKSAYSAWIAINRRSSRRYAKTLQPGAVCRQDDLLDVQSALQVRRTSRRSASGWIARLYQQETRLNPVDGDLQVPIVVRLRGRAPFECFPGPVTAQYRRACRGTISPAPILPAVPQELSTGGASSSCGERLRRRFPAARSRRQQRDNFGAFVEGVGRSGASRLSAWPSPRRACNSAAASSSSSA